MKIDRNKIDRLTELSDSEFAGIIKKAILSAGGSEQTACSAAAAAPIIKQRLKKASDPDIEKIAEFIGSKNASELLGESEK